MKTIIAGGRNFKPERKHIEWLDGIIMGLPVTEVISGGALGADRFGENIALNRGIKLKLFMAHWENGRKAGPIRNQKMADYADACVLFPGGKGTADMKARAMAAGLKIIEWSEE
jgi:hypothetical protein